MLLLVVVVGLERRWRHTHQPQDCHTRVYGLILLLTEVPLWEARAHPMPLCILFRAAEVRTMTSMVMRILDHLSFRTLCRLNLRNLQALGDAVRLTLSLQALTLLARRVRVRLGGIEGFW